MSEDNLPPDLPRGYKERADVFIFKIMPAAEKLIDICEEFGCPSIHLYGNDNVKVVITRTG